MASKVFNRVYRCQADGCGRVYLRAFCADIQPGGEVLAPVWEGACSRCRGRNFELLEVLEAPRYIKRVFRCLRARCARESVVISRFDTDTRSESMSPAWRGTCASCGGLSMTQIFKKELEPASA